MPGKYLFELMGNHPENLKLLTDSLFDIKESMYTNLYNAQKALVGMDRFDFIFDATDENNKFDDGSDEKRSRIWSITSNEGRFFINKSIVKPSTRSEFRRSNYYKRALTIADIQNEQTIFTHSPIVFIEGELYTGIKIIPDESSTEIIFPFKSSNAIPEEVMNREEFISQVLTHNHKLTILFVQNHSNLYLNQSKTANKFVIGGNILSNTIKNGNIDSFVNPIVFMNNPLINKNKHKMAVASTHTWNKADNVITVTSTVDKRVTTTKWSNCWRTTPLSITSIIFGRSCGCRFINSKFFRGATNGDDVLPMPCPTENILLFKVDKITGKMCFVHDPNVLKIYYPDIYEITSFSDGEEYYAISLYSDDTDSLGSWYKDELKLYRLYAGISVSKYNTDSIHNYVKNYTPVSMTYDIDNFNKSTYVDPVHYKLDKFKEMIYKDGDLYKFYLDKLVDYTPQYEILCSNFTTDEYIIRRRFDNHSEISNPNRHVTFDRMCRMFIIRADVTERIVMWIDSVLYQPKYMFTEGEFTYIYVPYDEISMGSSIITIEKYKDFDYISKVAIDSSFDISKPIEISYPNKKIIPNHVYITYEVNGVEKYADPTKYTLYYKVDDELRELTGTEFYPYDAIYLKLNDGTYLNSTLKMNISDTSFTVYNGTSNEIEINRKINNDKSNFLLFRNGLHIPQIAVNADFSENVNGPHKFKIMLISDNDTDEFALYYVPTKYYQIHFQANIQPSGFVDLTGKINKPLDFKWHDIYLNGKRLTDYQVEILGPYLLKIENVQSTKNLAIYQKNLDPYVPFIDDGLLQDYSHNLVVNTDLNGILKEGTLPDTEEDILEDLIIDFIGFFEEYLSTFDLINPDKEQITTEMLMKYPMAFDEFNNMFINPGTTKGLEFDAFFEPDKNMLTIKK